MLDDAPGLRFILAGLRIGLGVALGLLAIGLVTDVRVEEIDMDCGFGPVAAVEHDEPACRVDGRNQTLGALTAGALSVWLLTTGRRERRDRRGRIGYAGLGGASSGLDVLALEELRARRRRAWTLAVVAFVGVVASTAVAVRVDAEPDLATDERNAVVTSARSSSDVVVSYRDEGGRREAAVSVDPDRELGTGDGVRVRIQEDGTLIAVAPYEDPGWPVLVWLGFVILLGVGAYLLWRARQTWHILEQHQWRRLDPAPHVREASPAVWVEHGMPMMFETTRPRPMAIYQGRGKAVEIAGGDEGLVVLRHDGRSMQLARRRPVLVEGAG